MEISNEVRSRCIASYMPCMGLVRGNKVYIIGVNWGENEIWYADTKDGEVDYDAIPEMCPIEEYQLILKPLSSISDEDAIEVAKIHFGSSFPEKVLPNDYSFVISVGKRLSNNINNTLINGLTWLEITDYLRSKSYLLPYMGIDLLSAGIAITPEQGEKE